MSVLTVHRQFGSKVRSAERLLRLVPSDAVVWVEAFAGTAAMTLSKPPHPVEHLNDLNGDVVNLFEVMRDPASLARLCELIEFTPYAQEEFERCRSEVWVTDADDAPDAVERARRFLVASWQAIGGKQIVRSNWRLDLGRSWLIGTWGRLPSRLLLAAHRLKLAHIHRRHIVEMVEMFGPRREAVLFLDPPYPVETRGTHETMYAVEMVAAEHAALALQLRNAKARVLLTISEGTVYSEILADCHVTRYPVRGLRNQVKTELALTNYEPAGRAVVSRQRHYTNRHLNPELAISPSLYDPKPKPGRVFEMNFGVKRGETSRRGQIRVWRAEPDPEPDPKICRVCGVAWGGPCPRVNCGLAPGERLL